jgi:hypothetical protein
VSHSTLNFKDGLAITGASPVVRKFPLDRRHRLCGARAQRRAMTASRRGTRSPAMAGAWARRITAAMRRWRG